MADDIIATTPNRSKILDWELLLPSGPALAHHVGCVINNKFFIHGGITKHRSTTPSNKLYVLDFSTMIWDEVRKPGSPSLSHHACVTLDNRYMLLIGGWNGHRRTTALHVFDSKETKWYPLEDSGFTEGAGLSSHAALVLCDGSILVVGREGSLRTEKLHGCAYILSGDVNKGSFVYNKLSEETCSRSGHTLNNIGNIMYIIGGREDDLVEFHNGFSSTEPIGQPNSLFRYLSNYFNPLLKVPKGRKNHIAISGKDCIFIHGGETFDGRFHEAVGDMLLVKTKPELTFYYIGRSLVNRASHVCVNTGDRILFHGGRGWKNVIYGDCYELKFHPAIEEIEKESRFKMATAASAQLPVDWELLSAEGPRLANHAGCLIGNTVYVHGGIEKYGSTTPTFKFYKFDLSSARWTEVSAAGSPALSHHACVTLENRYMILIGGWDGRQRVSKIYAFDVQEQRWLPIVDKGFPEGAGLSSHAALVLKTGEIMIVGREGSLRIQRKHGNVYVLSGSVQKGEFTYRKMTNATSSRSGHSINTVGNSVYITGGRDDNLVEFHPGYSSQEPIGSLNSQFPEITQHCKQLTKPPSGRKNHVSFVGKDCFIIHGGDTFDGRSREPVSEMFLVLVKPHLSYYKLGNSSVPRSSHVCVNTGDRVIIHGGNSGKATIHGDCLELKLKK